MKRSNLQCNNDTYIWNSANSTDDIITPQEDGFYVNSKTKEVCKINVMNQNKTAMDCLKKSFETAKENNDVQKAYENMISKYARRLSEALDTNNYTSETEFTRISFHDARKNTSNPNCGHPIEGLSPNEIKEMPTLLCRIMIQSPWINSSIFKSIQTNDITLWDLANIKLRTDVFDKMKVLGYIDEWAIGANEELIFERTIPNPYYYDGFRKSPIQLKIK